jgi:Transposase DDE domain
MYVHTPLFGKIHTPKAPVAQTAQRLGSLPLLELQSLCATLIPPSFLAAKPEKENSRLRLYPLELTFWAFLSQVLAPGSSCRHAVRQIQAHYQSRSHPPELDSQTSAYCQARARLPLEDLHKINRHLAQTLEQARSAALDLLAWGHPLRLIDGTALTMPDTPANQAAFPQPSFQKPGCGFPQMRLLGLFSLNSGALLASAHSPMSTDENRLFRQLWPNLQPADIAVADRHFCSYGNIAGLKNQGVDSLFRLHSKRNADFRQGRRLGKNDRLLTWYKPAHYQPSGMSDQVWESLPAQITVRLVRFRVPTANNRTKKIIMVTTLLDPLLWPVQRLAQIFARRWQIELNFDDLKTTLQMDTLSCKKPALIHKELQLHLIAYNVVRWFMLQAAVRCDVALYRLSFKGTLDTLRHYSQAIRCVPASQRNRRSQLVQRMLAVIAQDLVPHRPDRKEPRCLKKRPKPYPFMTRPRSEMEDRPKWRPRKRKPRNSLT